MCFKVKGFLLVLKRCLFMNDFALKEYLKSSPGLLTVVLKGIAKKCWRKLYKKSLQDITYTCLMLIVFI